jgi:hypothetical protein
MPAHLAGVDRLLRDEALVALRAYDVLRINVRSFCGRDAVAAVRAISRE